MVDVKKVADVAGQYLKTQRPVALRALRKLLTEYITCRQENPNLGARVGVDAPDLDVLLARVVLTLAVRQVDPNAVKVALIQLCRDVGNVELNADERATLRRLLRGSKPGTKEVI